MAKNPARRAKSVGETVEGSVGKRRLRVASYNINGITSRLEVLLRWGDRRSEPGKEIIVAGSVREFIKIELRHDILCVLKGS